MCTFETNFFLPFWHCPIRQGGLIILLSSHPVFVLPNKYVCPSLYFHFSGLADLLHILIRPETFKCVSHNT